MLDGLISETLESMSHPHPRAHAPASRALLGSRALAILSCALALLAAQPVLGASASASPKAITLQLSAAPSPAASPVRDPRRQNTRREPSLASTDGSSARRLHILATVEILQRLLRAELRPPTAQLLPSILCPLVLLVTLDLQPPALPALPGHDPPLPLSHERLFLLTHALLAPPVA